MLDNQTILLATIRNLGHHHRDFQTALTKQMANDSRLTPVARQLLEKIRLNHSEVQILSIVNRTGELAYAQLNEQVTFSQGMLSRYIKKLLQAELLHKVALPDNKKAYRLAITATGKVLAEQHDQLHERENQAFQQALAQFSDQQLQDTIAVLQAIEGVKLP